MLKNTLLVFALLLVTIFSYGQRNCGSMDYLEHQLMHDEERRINIENIEKFTENFIRENGGNRAVQVTIPVVFHVVYNTTAENISDAQILSQLNVLNLDFRRLNSDANNTWPQAADTEVEFCLASVDPSGNSTNGITRTSTTRTSFSSNDYVKYNSTGGKDAWPAASYLNIWVCDLSSTLLGYAQFPGGPAATDGVVIDYAYFGTIGTATYPFHLGRTATHEVGHWLNLRHIWGDGGCNVDDFVTDTPTSDAANTGCPNGHVSCSTIDMIENYMDYTDDACMNLFTAGQKSRMLALFAPGGARASIASSAGCGNASGPTCSDGLQNGDETGVDCGGSTCPPCGGGGGSNTQLLGSYFESGWDGWADGGVDCARYSGSRSWEGSYSINLQDNSGTPSAMTSPTFNASGYASIDVEFYFYANSMEAGEDFWVRYSGNGGSTWTTVAAYARGTNFNNKTFYVATVNIASNLTSNAKIRFQCDASDNNDDIYIDQVTVTGIAAPRNNGQTSTIEELFVRDANTETIEQELIITPNPVSDLLFIQSNQTIQSIRIFNIAGQLALTQSVKDEHNTSINV